MNDDWTITNITNDYWIEVTTYGDSTPQWIRATTDAMNAGIRATTDAMNAAVLSMRRAMESIVFTSAELAALADELNKEPEMDEFWTPEPVIGWRAWTLCGNPPTILGGQNAKIWRKRTFSATHEGQSHSAPRWHCYCGINAAKTLDDLRHSGYSSGIYGQVALTGVVHEYERGYRAEKGEMLNLSIQRGRTGKSKRGANDLAKILSDHYKIPVVVE